MRRELLDAVQQMRVATRRMHNALHTYGRMSTAIARSTSPTN